MADKQQEHKSSKMLFNAWNYKVLALGLFLVVGGFTAMYLENEVEGFISLFISPIVIMAGYVTVIFAIMRKGQPNNGSPEHSSG